jgi:hypothetical protein
MTNQFDFGSKTTLDDVKRKAWAACDTFRGVLDASEYKNYVLVTCSGSTFPTSGTRMMPVNPPPRTSWLPEHLPRAW